MALRWAAAALLLLVGLFHGPDLANGFVYDDAWTLVANPIVRDPSNLTRLLGPELARAGVPDAARPVMLASEMVDHALWGAKPWGYHLQNLLWHAAVVLLVFGGLVRLQGSLAVALAPAALVAVHPLNVEVVAAINYREDLLAAAFVLLALTALEAARRRQSSGSRFWPAGLRAAALLSALLACLAKESGYLAPLLLVALDLCRPDPPEVRRRLLDPILLLVASALSFAWRWWAVGAVAAVSRTAEIGHHHHDGAARIGRSMVTFFQGLFQFLCPVRLAPEYPEVLPGVSGWLLLTVGGAALGLLVALALRLRRRAPWIALGLLWAVVAYLPNLGLQPLTNLRADRYFYLATIGLALALSSAVAEAIRPLRRLRERTVLEVPVVALLVTGVLLVLGVRSLRQGRIWRNDLALFSAATRAAPQSHRAWLGLANAHLRAGRLLAALSASQRALALGDDFHARQMHGLILMSQGDLPGAALHLGRALADGPPPHHRAQILNNLGYVELRMGKVDQALARFALSRQLDPGFDRPWLNAARALADRGDLSGAAALLDGLLVRVPESIDGWKQLGALHERAGRAALARVAYQRARALSRTDAETARALERLGP
jgi:protein O-mannosyl-transferase